MQTLIEQWNAMTPEERSLWIGHNVHGWSDSKIRYDEDMGFVEAMLYHPFFGDEMWVDYNPEKNIQLAMEAEEKIMQMDDWTKFAYVENLRKVRGWDVYYVGYEIMLDLIHASAADRCAAMYLTLMQQKERR